MKRRNWSHAAAIAGLWTLFGIYSGAESHYRRSFGKMPLDWGYSLLVESSYCWLWAALTPLVLLLARRFPLERGKLWRNIPVHLAASVFCSVLTKTLWDVMFETSGPLGWAPFSWTKYVLSLSVVFTEGLTLYWLIVMAAYSVDYYRRYRNGLVQSSRLQTQLAQAQLQALKMQLHPHFLFNTLHSISALVHEDAEAADRMIVRLSDLLRLSLESANLQQVPLHQELRFLDLYLSIEKTRFEERLEVTFNIEEETREAMVPNMILQPLVENSIRHGLADQVGQGRIAISAARDGERLVLKVTDNGRGLSSEGISAIQQGIGLGATRGRLLRLYGNGQSLLLRNLREGGVEASICVPFVKEMVEVNAGYTYLDR